MKIIILKSAFILSLSLFIAACDSDSSSSISIPEEFRASTYKEYQVGSASQSYSGIWLYVGTRQSMRKTIYSDSDSFSRQHTGYHREIAFFNEVPGPNGVEIHITECDGYTDDIYTINNNQVTANDDYGETTTGTATGYNQLKMHKLYSYNSSKEVSRTESNFHWIKVSDDVNANIGSITHNLIKNGQPIVVSDILKCFYDDVIDGVSTSTIQGASSTNKYWNRLYRYYDDVGGEFSFEFEEGDDQQEDSYWVDFRSPSIYMNGQYSEFNTINTIEEFAWSVGIDVMSFSVKNSDNGETVSSDGGLIITF